MNATTETTVDRGIERLAKVRARFDRLAAVHGTDELCAVVSKRLGWDRWGNGDPKPKLQVRRGLQVFLGIVEGRRGLVTTISRRNANLVHGVLDDIERNGIETVMQREVAP